MTEQVFPAAPTSVAAGRIITSPFQFVLSGEDNLRIVAVNALPGVRLTMQGRRLDEKNKVNVYSYDHVPASSRTVTSQDYSLGVGAILNLTVFASAGAPTIGQTYVMVQLIRGLGGATIVLGTLLAGYVTSVANLGWPGSPVQSSIEGPGTVRLIAGTTPGAGAEISETVPTGARWELLTFCTTFTPGGGPIVRTPILVASRGGSTMFEIAAQAGVDVPNVLRVSWQNGLGVSTPQVGTRTSQSLPVRVPLLAGAILSTFTNAIQAGDQYSAVSYGVREWLEPT